MNFNTLRYLVVLAQERSFARAAKKLFVVQPTLRQAISALEEDLGTKLYVRGSSPLMLTPAGSVFVKWAQETLKSQGDTVQQIAEMTQGNTRLVLALPNSIAMIHAPALIPAFAALRPDCNLSIWEHSANVSQQTMQNSQELHLLVGSLFDPAPILQTEFLYRESLVLAMPADHPLCPTGERLDFASLREMPFLQLYSSPSVEIRLNTICGDYGFTPRTRMRAGGFGLLLEMVNTGLGATLIPADFAAWRSLPNVRFFPIEHPDNSRSLYMAWRKDCYITQDMAAMMDLLRQQLGSKDGQ